MPAQKLIIDADPGVDDILALLLALTSSSDEIEILLLSASYGNIEVDVALTNIITLFYVIDKEIQWRKENGISIGFEALLKSKPLVALGPDRPLEDGSLEFMSDYYQGKDGLAGCRTTHPHFDPPSSWKSIFELGSAREAASYLDTFRVSTVPAHKEMLRLLRENPPDTITVISFSPLTNIAMAANEDAETLLRAKEVIVMGGAVDTCGNSTPCSEYNTYADPIAAARVFALTSPNPASTMPLTSTLPPYPKTLSKTLNITLFPTDTTSLLLLPRSRFLQRIEKLVEIGSPVAQWTSVFVDRIMDKCDPPGLELHDISTIWYVLTKSSERWVKSPKSPEDIRVETLGQWTRGMMVIDRRNRLLDGTPDENGNILGDYGGWLNKNKGNRVTRIIDTPGEESLVQLLLDRIYGPA